MRKFCRIICLAVLALFLCGCSIVVENAGDTNLPESQQQKEDAIHVETSVDFQASFSTEL